MNGTGLMMRYASKFQGESIIIKKVALPMKVEKKILKWTVLNPVRSRITCYQTLIL